MSNRVKGSQIRWSLTGLLLVLGGLSPAWAQNTFPATGNVGIGTTNPTSTAGWAPLLDLRGAFPGMMLDATAAQGRKVSIGSHAVWGGGALTFFDETSGAPRMVGDASGNVGVGTADPTSPAG